MARKKKYQAKHELVRKHVPKGMWQAADSAIDHMGRIIDKTGPRDVVYIIAYLAAVDLSYQALKAVQTSVLPWMIRTLFPWLPQPLPEGPVEIDWRVLSMSFVVAYMILKIDVEDVASALNKLSSTAIKALVPSGALVAP